MTNDYNESPEAIKTDIERTRQDMSSKIEQIQARLSPDHLKVQAQETVRDVMRDSTESLTSYLSENSKELGASVAHVIKHNPIPAALIGLGIGWLLVENYTSSGSSSRNYNQQWRNQQRHEWHPAESEYAGYASNRYETGGMTPSAAQYQSTGAYQSSTTQYAGSQYTGSQYQSGQSNTGGYNSYSSSEQPGWQTSQMRERAGEKAEQWRDSAQQMGEQARQRVGELGHQVSEQASAIGEQASHYTQQAREQVGHLGEQMSHAGEQAQVYMQQTGQQLQRRLEDNPLLFGGVALAVGALVGLALPETRRENEMMGEWRDEVIHSAQEVAHDAVDRAQHVAEEMRPKLEETANKVVSDLTQTGKEAMEDVKQTGREALEQTKQTGKEAADKAQHEMNQTADKAKNEAEKVADRARSETGTSSTASTSKRS